MEGQEKQAGRVFAIQRFSTHDGPGIRTTVFFKGCPLRCQWCHNPEGLRFEAELAYREAECAHCGRCQSVCPAGAHTVQQGRHRLERERCKACGQCEEQCPANALRLLGKSMSAEEVVAEALRDMPFYGQQGGITCSGGECAAQPDFLRAVLREAKVQGLRTAVDTCGAVAWEVLESLLPCVDLFLYDIKAVSPKLHLLGTGMDNAVILENYRRLIKAGAAVEVRLPIIPSFNDSEEEQALIEAFLRGQEPPVAITRIPFHTPGEGKYAQLGQIISNGSYIVRS